jgi:hypothetical protein
MSPRTIVRYGFSEFDTWHDALPDVPHAVMSCFGSLDAPETIPAGAMRSTPMGAVRPVVTARPDAPRFWPAVNGRPVAA